MSVTMTPSTLPNIPLLDLGLSHIRANPGEWDQKTWRCGTGGCLAFHVARLSGAEWLMGDPRDPYFFSPCERGCCPPGVGVIYDDTRYYTPEDVVTPDGQIMHVRAYATAVLGLSLTVSEALFRGDNSLADLEAWAGLLRVKVAAMEAAAAAKPGSSSPPAGAEPSPACDTASTAPAREPDHRGLLHAV